MRLTKNQRALRNVTRINNKLKKEYPLFFEQFKTDVEEQTEIINKR